MRQKGFAPLALIIFFGLIAAAGFLSYKLKHPDFSIKNPLANIKINLPLATATASPEPTSAPKTATPAAKQTQKPTAKPATPTPTTAPVVNNTCEINILTDTSSTTTVKLVAAASSKNSSYITGAQWDFDGNGSWDTAMNLSNESINHTYSDGNHTAKLQLNMSDGSTTSTCSKSFSTPNGFTVSLTGSVYEDINCNDMREPSEKGLGGVTVQITNMDGYATLANLTTDSDGNYNFNYVLSGNNSISIQPNAHPLDNYGIPTIDAAHTTSLNVNQTHINMDLGEVPAPVYDYCH